MDLQEFSFKELYSVRIKSTYPIEVAGKTIEPGEVIALFDKIQIANFSEYKDHVSARGGYLNEPRVVWDNTKQMDLDFVQGIFSKSQFALMNNLKYLEPVETKKELIGEREILITGQDADNRGKVRLRYEPTCDVYVYDGITGEKFPREQDKTSNFYWKYNGGKEIEIIDDKREITDRKIIVDYCFTYDGATSILKVGKEFTTGFLWLEGKTRVKDDETGLVKTGILRIPKLKLMSDLSIRVGQQAGPMVGRFKAVAYPTGSQGNKEIMELIFLEDDVDSDM